MKDKIAAHSDKVDVLLALNQESADLHKTRLIDNSLIIYDSNSVKSDKGMAIPIAEIIKEAHALDMMRNSCIIGAMCKAIGIEKDVLENVFRADMPREIDLNLKVAFRGFSEAKEFIKIERIEQNPCLL